jgi:hypothetical protein
MIKSDVYVKDDQSALINDCGYFIYEVFTFVQFENVYNMANHRYFTSTKEIPNIIRFFKINPYIEVQCYLYSAPKKWLIENNFILYSKPLKIKKNEQKSVSN